MEQRKHNRISFFKQMFTKTATVQQVVPWGCGNLCEVDIHMPNVNFSAWIKTPVIRCLTSGVHYSDYTPSVWDADKHTCRLYVDTSHVGAGSQWARNVKKNDTLYYLNLAFDNHYPIDGKKLIVLGDQTSVGYFSALQQLAAASSAMQGYIVLQNHDTALNFKERCPWLPIEAVSSYVDIVNHTEQLIAQLPNRSDCMFYLVGYAKMVVSLRQYLKTKGIGAKQIKSRGFWH